MSSELLSHVFSIISLCLYSIVYLPQFRLIYNNKSSDGISIYMLILWSQADSLSLLSSILINLPLSVIVIGWYHFVIGAIMILFTFYYTHNKTIIHYISIALFLSFNLIILVLSYFFVSNTSFAPHIGQTIGWCTTILYIIGRLPQIKLNYTNKSTDGLSALMYIYTILANSSYLLSILFISTESNYILSNLFIIVCVIITILLDLYVIYQCYYYRTLQYKQYSNNSRFYRYYC
jgi:uncharacterized protein with PQ loop repeat